MDPETMRTADQNDEERTNHKPAPTEVQIAQAQIIQSLANIESGLRTLRQALMRLWSVSAADPPSTDPSPK